MEHHADKTRYAMTADPSDQLHWTGWHRRHWPADIIRRGLRFYAFDKKSRRFTAVLEITKGHSFSYTTKVRFAKKVKDSIGTLPYRKDAHRDRIPESQSGQPCTGIAFRWRIVEEADIVSIGDMVDGLGRVAGNGPVARIKWQPDAHIQKIVAGWPYRFEPARARSLGFAADRSIDEIVQAHIDDQLGGKHVS